MVADMSWLRANPIQTLSTVVSITNSGMSPQLRNIISLVLTVCKIKSNKTLKITDKMHTYIKILTEEKLRTWRKNPVPVAL
jgi:hypothetical protein